MNDSEGASLVGQRSIGSNCGTHPAPAANGHTGEHAHSSRWALVLGALGVVYGDIGTSPLYALKECFSPHNPQSVLVSHDNVLGVLSLVFWSLTLVISIKYLTFIMRADNDGAGGILALLALVPRGTTRRSHVIVLLALFGTALLYGDGVITPAISVLSAVEGLGIATHAFEPLVVPITLGVILGLFAVQKRGTAGIGKVFGPLTVLWFVTIAMLGLPGIIANPSVLAALNPGHAVSFFIAHGWLGALVLGSVFLAVTGGEALYADMGHFGRWPIRTAWYGLVFPSLLLNYFGQGAMLLRDKAAVDNPFYALVPHWALYPTVAIATAATVVASQALISGTFSLTQQAVSLGYFPRVSIVHTSASEAGQIYVPEINTVLMVSCLICVTQFRSSTALAAAYGIAVTGTMAITTILYATVLARTWHWPWIKVAPLLIGFLCMDLSFLSANVGKIAHGGWFPLAIGGAGFTIMTTWQWGRARLAAKIRASSLPLELFLQDVAITKPLRVDGTAVFMAANRDAAPSALLHHIKHTKVLHQVVILLSVENLDVPEVLRAQRVQVESLGEGFHRVRVQYGFMQAPDVPDALAHCAKHGLKVDFRRVTYFVGRETLVIDDPLAWRRLRKRLFAFVSRNAPTATAYFRLPPSRVVELGMQIEL
jgi:KUP system potassium uptake protein